MFENKDDLLRCVETIKDSGEFDLTTMREASFQLLPGTVQSHYASFPGANYRLSLCLLNHAGIQRQHAKGQVN